MDCSNKLDCSKFFHSKAFKISFVVIAVVIAALLIFKLGVFVGYRKANFSYRWAENYHKNFGGPREGFFNDFYDRDFIDGHGMSGLVMKIDGNVLIIKDRDNTEKTVTISDQTVIRVNRDTIKITDLKIDDRIVIIGSPDNQGQIEAKFIRVMR